MTGVAQAGEALLLGMAMCALAALLAARQMTRGEPAALWKDDE